MNLFDLLAHTVGRGLNVLRGGIPVQVLPPVTTMPVRPPGGRKAPPETLLDRVQPAPAATRGPALPTMLDAEDFTAGAPWAASQWFTLAEFKAPAGVAWKIPAGPAYRAYLNARAYQAGLNGVASNRTITCPDLIDTPQSAPTLPTVYHPEVQIWAKVGAVWNRANVTAINFSTGVVNYDEPANCTDVEAYYVHNNGEWRLRVIRELGNSDTSAVAVINSSMGATHSVDQISSESNHKWPRELLLFEGFRLSLEVKSSREHQFNTRSGHVLRIYAVRREVAALDAKRMRQLNEFDLREGV